MKSEKSKAKTKAKETIRYPILLEWEDNVVVLFLSEHVGSQVYPISEDMDMDPDWVPATNEIWKKFEGTIKLSND